MGNVTFNFYPWHRYAQPASLSQKGDQHYQNKIQKSQVPNKKISKNLSQNSPPFHKQIDKQSHLHQEPIIIQSKFSEKEKQVAEGYVQIQNLKQLIEKYHKDIQNSKSYAKKMKDPLKFKEFKVQSFENYLKGLQQLKLSRFQEPDRQRPCTKAVIGMISSGKSSLLNQLLGLNLKVSMGETTLSLDQVYNNDDVIIYDTPGQNQEFNTFKLEIVQQICTFDEIFILFNDSLKNIEQIVRVITTIKPKKTYLVRTFCDRAQGMDKSLEDQILTDYAILQKWKIKDVSIFKTSAKIKGGFQNNKVKDLLLRNSNKRVVD